MAVAHCNENPIYVFPEKELRGVSPEFNIHVFVSDLCIPRIGPHIFLQQNRHTDPGNIYSIQYMNVEIGDCGRTITFLGIFVSNLLYCVCAVHTAKACHVLSFLH